jgi:hypothetical protein
MRGRDKFDFLFKREACKRYIPLDAICLISRGLRLGDHSMLSKKSPANLNRIESIGGGGLQGGGTAWVLGC